MAENEYEGYKEKSIEILQKFGAKTWSRIEIKNKYGDAKGIILPRNKFPPDGFVEIKQKNGYNIGIPLDAETEIEVISQEPPMQVKFDQSFSPIQQGLPNVKLLGTGGTIASKLDYNTGGVTPLLNLGNYLRLCPNSLIFVIWIRKWSIKSFPKI